MCGTQNEEWEGDGVGGRAALLDTLFEGHGEVLNSSRSETMGLQYLCIPGTWNRKQAGSQCLLNE